MAGLQKPPPPSSTAEYMASGSRDKTIKVWDSRGICIKTLLGHDNWINALVFHPGGRYLLSVSDDRSLRCWDLSQDGKCVKVLNGLHDISLPVLRGRRCSLRKRIEGKEKCRFVVWLLLEVSWRENWRFLRGSCAWCSVWGRMDWSLQKRWSWAMVGIMKASLNLSPCSITRWICAKAEDPSPDQKFPKKNCKPFSSPGSASKLT